MRLLCATVISRCINASGAAGSDLDARDASCLVCHRRFGGEDNSWDMVVWPRLSECALQDSLSNRKRNVRLCCLVFLPGYACICYGVGAGHLPDMSNGD